MPAPESTVLLGTGQKLRNLQVTVIDQATGLPTSVLMEVVSIADSNGNVITDFTDYGHAQKVERYLKTITLLLYQIAGMTSEMTDVDIFDGAI